MYFNFRNDIWDLIQKSYPTGYCPDIYHPVTQSDSLQTKINYLQHKRQNVTVEVSVKGELGSYFPKECIALHAPPPKTSSCSQSWGQTQALLPQSWFLSFLLEFAEFRYLFSESLPVVSDESSAILESTGRYSLVVEELLLSLILTTGWEIPVREEA